MTLSALVESMPRQSFGLGGLGLGLPSGSDGRYGGRRQRAKQPGKEGNTPAGACWGEHHGTLPAVKSLWLRARSLRRLHILTAHSLVLVLFLCLRHIPPSHRTCNGHLASGTDTLLWDYWHRPYLHTLRLQPGNLFVCARTRHVVNNRHIDRLQSLAQKCAIES